MPTLDETLVTIPNVTLIETGTWMASTGECTFTEGDLAAAIAALDDPCVKAPRMRFGHTDARAGMMASAGGFDSQPCVGKFINLRLENDGTELVGDLAGVPKWLAEILPIAYPNRSVEAYRNVKTATGKEHAMVVTSVAVLGEEFPGVATLEDLAILFSEEGPDWAGELTGGDLVLASQGDFNMPEERISASVDLSDVRTAFYDQIATEESGRYWWWINQIYIEPSAVIADDGEGNTFFVTYSSSGNQVTFGDPQEVFIQWVNKESGKVAAEAGDHLPGGKPDHVYATADDSRPSERQDEWNDNQSKEAHNMSIDMSALRKLHGLPEDADEDAINAAISAAADAAAAAPEAEADADAEAKVTEPALVAASDAITVDPEMWASIQARLGQVDDIVATTRASEDKNLLDGAVRQGKFPPSRKAHYASLLAGPDRAGTIEFIQKLEATIPVTEIGGDGDGESLSADAVGYDQSWLSPAERARIAASQDPAAAHPHVVLEA